MQFNLYLSSVSRNLEIALWVAGNAGYALDNPIMNIFHSTVIIKVEKNLE